MRAGAPALDLSPYAVCRYPSLRSPCSPGGPGEEGDQQRGRVGAPHNNMGRESAYGRADVPRRSPAGCPRGSTSRERTPFQTWFHGSLRMGARRRRGVGEAAGENKGGGAVAARRTLPLLVASLTWLSMGWRWRLGDLSLFWWPPSLLLSRPALRVSPVLRMIVAWCVLVMAACARQGREEQLKHNQKNKTKKRTEIHSPTRVWE